MNRQLVCALIMLGTLSSTAMAAPGGKRPPNLPDSDNTLPVMRHNPMFDRLDSNEDGFVDSAELTAAETKRAEAVFARLDSNEDGVVTKAEFDAAPRPPAPPELDDAVKACASALITERTGETFTFPEILSADARFAVMDTNSDTQLTLEEMTAFGATKAATLLAKQDGNGDGLVSQEEWDQARQDRFWIAQAVRECQDDNGLE